MSASKTSLLSSYSIFFFSFDRKRSNPFSNTDRFDFSNNHRPFAATGFFVCKVWRNRARHGNNNNNNNNKKGKKGGTSLWHNAILPRPGAWKKQKIQFSTGAGACPRAWRVASPLTSHPLPSPFSFFGRDTRSPRAQGLVSRGSGWKKRGERSETGRYEEEIKD